MADLKKLALGRKGFSTPDVKKGVSKKSAKTGKTLEQTSAEEVGELESSFRDRLNKEDKRRKQATDSETWFCVYFNSRAEKEAFLRKYGLDRVGDKYLPGRAVDRALDKRNDMRIRDTHRDRR